MDSAELFEDDVYRVFWFTSDGLQHYEDVKSNELYVKCSQILEYYDWVSIARLVALVPFCSPNQINPFAEAVDVEVSTEVGNDADIF